MSPDRTTITRAEAIRRRKEEDLKLLEKLTKKNVSRPKQTPAPKSSSNTRMGWAASTQSAAHASKSRINHRFDIAMSSPYRQTRPTNQTKFPSISFSLPHISYGPRWLSLFVAILCLAGLYLMSTTAPFIVRDVSILGNNRINTPDIEKVLGVVDMAAAYINPTQIQNNILAAFPDIASAQVDVNIPAGVIVSVVERTPVAAWQENDQTVWVDASGFAFPPRGQVDNLPTILAAGDPPAPVNPDPAAGTQPFLPADLSKAIVTFSSNLPQGAAMIFDPQYGLGWNDPKGWKVFFGQTNGDNALKLQVYQKMLEHLSEKNIQPILISVEYPSAPFYRVEQ